MPAIRAAQMKDATRCSVDWVFVDPGFSSRARSCGLLSGSAEPAQLTFAQLRAGLVQLATSEGPPMNLVIEAPLSVAFGAVGNPIGRSVELRNGQARYWYVGLGCSVLVAATYLLRALTESKIKRDIRLFEGLVSFKPKGIPSSHSEDVLKLRSVAWGEHGSGRIVPPEELAASPTHTVQSAFLVAGMDFGVPPVVAVGI
jgi:hypothetical protein